MTKEQAFEIIQKYNPAADSYHVHIRKPEEVYTFEEISAGGDADYYMNLYGFGDDLNKERIKKALESGYIDVYHGNEKKGIACFVATSSGMAYEYAGGCGRPAKVYHARVRLEDIAWINAGEGIALKKIKWNKIVVSM